MSRPDEVYDAKGAHQSPNDRFQQVVLEPRIGNMENQALPTSAPWEQEQDGPRFDAVEDKEDPT